MTRPKEWAPSLRVNISPIPRQPAPLGLAELMRRLQFEDQVLDNKHRMAFLSQLRDDARVVITAIAQ
ncbi:MAG TPA: hypothetical protein VN039_02625, partial [Nitrospira sp.]|nr:hypothetical protein [Nitrospira sp.]